VFNVNDVSVAEYQGLCSRGFLRECRRVLRIGFSLSLYYYSMALLLLTNIIVVGHVDTASLASLLLGNVLVVSLYVFLCGVANHAISTLCARSLEEGNPGQAGLWLQVGLVWVSLLFLPLCAVACVFAGDYLPREAAHFHDATVSASLVAIYCRWSIFWLVPATIMAVVSAWLDALHEEWPRGLLAVTLVVLNAALNVCFVHGVGSWSGWGLKGSPIAQGVAFWVALAILCIVMFAVRRVHRRAEVWPGFSLAAMKPSSGALLIRSGVPMALSDAAVDWALQLLVLLASTLSSANFVAYGVLVATLSLYAPLALSFSVAVSIRVGSLLSAETRRPAWAATRAGALCSSAVMVVVGGILLLLRHQIPSVFIHNSIDAHDATAMIPAVAAHAALSGLVAPALGALEAMERTGSLLAAQAVGPWVAGVGFGIVQCAYRDQSYKNLAWALPLGQGVFALTLWIGILLARDRCLCWGRVDSPGVDEPFLDADDVEDGPQPLPRDTVSHGPTDVRLLGTGRGGTVSL